MTHSFNLVDEPWIPCVMPDGATREFSLRECLINANGIREIHDQSPLVTISLYRFLLAVLHRIHDGPESIEDWAKLWKAGEWSASKISEYLAKWRHRFDLFDPEHPFYQDTALKDEKQTSILRLRQEAASGNNNTLFDHNFSAISPPETQNEVARLLITTQAFAIGGGVSSPFNLCHAPLVGGYSVLIVGSTLFETLMLNMSQYDDAHPDTMPRTSGDIPAWELDKPIAIKKDDVPVGYLDYLTWQSRRIMLFPEQEGAGVRWISYLQGRALYSSAVTDPLRCYRKDEEKGWMPRKLQTDKAVWRDSAALFQISNTQGRTPAAFNWLAMLHRESIITRVNRPCFSVFGMVSDQAKVLLWRHDKMPLPVKFLADANFSSDVQIAIEHAETLSICVRSGVYNLHAYMERPADGKIPAESKNQISARSTAATRAYWSRLETPFRLFIENLSSDSDGSLSMWKEKTKKIAEDVFTEATRDIDGSARALRALTQAEGVFYGSMKKTIGGMS